MIITARHRSLALAERHLSQLRRKYESAEILSRRNSQGRYSNKGRSYVIEVREKTKKKQTEFVVHFDYGSKKAKNLIRFQVHIFGPSTASDAEAIRAIKKIERGERVQGWTQKTIYWGHPPKAANRRIVPEVEGVKSSALSSGEARVSRR